MFTLTLTLIHSNPNPKPDPDPDQVIVVESTTNVSFLLPISLTIFTAKFIGDLFSEGIYDLHVKLKRFPFLPDQVTPNPNPNPNPSPGPSPNPSPGPSPNPSPSPYPNPSPNPTSRRPRASGSRRDTS